MIRIARLALVLLGNPVLYLSQLPEVRLGELLDISVFFGLVPWSAAGSSLELLDMVGAYFAGNIGSKYLGTRTRP